MTAAPSDAAVDSRDAATTDDATVEDTVADAAGSETGDARRDVDESATPTGGVDDRGRVDDPTANAGSDGGFLRSVEFLTGPDPNLGSFLLVVGMVSIVFVALFQLTIPAPISYVLTVGVLFVTVLSALFAFLLDAFGYFDAPAPAATVVDEPRPGARPWVPTTGSPKPLPPLLNFDAELRAYADMFDGDLPPVFDAFVEDYVRLKTNTESRASIASDLRADLNPIGTLFAPGSDGDRLYETISERLFRYIGSERGLLTVDRATFADADGTDTDLADLAGSVGRVAVDVVNDGEAVDADVVVEFRDEGDAVVATRTCSTGVLGPGARRTVEADVFVPADAVRATTTLGAIDTGRRVDGEDRPRVAR